MYGVQEEMIGYNWKNPYYHIWELFAGKTSVGLLYKHRGDYWGKTFPWWKEKIVSTRTLSEAKAALIELYEKSGVN